jgi:peptide methionine sulfoxide reductase MsrA
MLLKTVTGLHCLDARKYFAKPIVTKISAAAKFYVADEGRKRTKTLDNFFVTYN